MRGPNKTTGITAEERRLQSERLRSRILGLCDGFEAGASVDVKQQEQRIAELEAENARLQTELKEAIQRRDQDVATLGNQERKSFDAKSRLEIELAQAKQDTARLDWTILNKPYIYATESGGWRLELTLPKGQTATFRGNSSREAIDAAMYGNVHLHNPDVTNASHR